MRYRLALDIGTASCGLVAVELDSQNQPLDIVHHGLYIFPEPLLPAKSGGVGEPKKAARRAARMARRIIERRARRLKRIAYLASLLGLNHRDIKADSGQALHAARARAVSERIELPDLLRVMLKIAKRRGYAGEFRTRKDSERGPVQAGIDALASAMKAAGTATLGQYLELRYRNGETLKLKEIGLYAHRNMVMAEFDSIWDEQARHHPVLSESKPDPLDRHGRLRPVREQFREAVFLQRPLKSVAPMVGNCPLEPSLPRAPMAQPALQAFRVEKQLADLRWGMGRTARELTVGQKDVIREMLNDPATLTKEGKLSFKKIYARLEEQQLMPEHRRTLNMERSSREDLTGNRTLRAFDDLGVLDAWQALERIAKVRVINFLADLGSPEQVDLPDWHTRFTKGDGKTPRSLDPSVVSFVNRMLETGKFDRLSKMGFESGRASYSVRALEKLATCMREQGLDEHGAIAKTYPSAEATGELLPHLPLPKPTGNVVVDAALRVVRGAVNEALATLGEPPAEAVVELTRDMALGIKARGDIEKRIDRNRRQRENARKVLAEHDKKPTDRNVLRYLLWQQQENHCPYCGERISLEQAVDGNVTNLEHILPRSLTRIGAQRNHLLLAHRKCNDLKGDRTPYEAFGHDAERWTAVKYCASVLQSNKQFAKARLLLLEGYEHEVLDDESIAAFSERQFAETSWIGKLTAQWMREIAPRVSVSRGALTAHLRRIWKLDTVIAQARYDAGLPVLDTDGREIAKEDFERFKPYWEGHTESEHPRTDRKIDKRIDHRHHLIDALVIAQTSRSLYQRIARDYKTLAERRKEGQAVRLRIQASPPIADIRDKAMALVREANIHHKADRYTSGKFFQETAYRKVLTDDGKSRLVVRVPLWQLADAAGSVERTRKAISDIVSAGTRKMVLAALEQRLSEGKSVKEALAEPVYENRYGASPKRAIRRVAVFQRSGRGFVDGSSALRIEHGRLEKHYLSDGYAYVAIAQEGGRLVLAESVSVFAANRRKSAPREGEKRFFRGDTLFDPKTGKRYVVHQLLANATIRAAEVTEARNWIYLGSESGAVQLGASALARLERQ